MFNKVLDSLPIFSKVSSLKKDLESLSRKKWKISFDSRLLKQDLKNFQDGWKDSLQNLSHEIFSSFSHISKKAFRAFFANGQTHAKSFFKNESFLNFTSPSKEKSFQSSLPEPLNLGLEVGKNFFSFIHNRILESKNHQWQEMKTSDDIFLKEYQNLKKQEINTYEQLMSQELNTLQKKQRLYIDSYLKGEISNKFLTKQLSQLDQVFQTKETSLFSKSEEANDDFEQMQEYISQKHELFNKKKDLMSWGLMPWKMEEFDKTESQLHQVYQNIDFLDKKQAAIDNELKTIVSQKDTNVEKSQFHIAGFSQENLSQPPKPSSVVNVSLNIQASHLTPDQISQEVVKSLVSRIRSEANKGSFGGF